jgi:curved DNA-binding protein CbpA
MPADLYDVLGTSTDASAEGIKRAYRERVREYHPDVNDHPEGDAQFKLIRKANDVLSDPSERKDYDRMGHREYVETHLDDLPPVSVFPDEDLPDGARTGSESTASTATTTSTTGASTSTTSRPSGRSRSSRSSRSRTAGDSTDRTTGSTSANSASASTQTGSTSSETSSNIGNHSSNEQSTTAGAEQDTWDAAASARKTTETDSTVPAGVRRRRGLKRWYGVVALSLLAYLAGLGLYAYTRLGAVREMISNLAAAPVATLLAPFPLLSPTAYLLDAARAASNGTPTLGLLLLAGTVLLPLVVLTTVGRFGRGAAWMYALPSLAPAIVFGLWYVMAVPTWLALVGLIVLPVLSGGGFLVDVGRYLRATR